MAQAYFVKQTFEKKRLLEVSTEKHSQMLAGCMYTVFILLI